MGKRYCLPLVTIVEILQSSLSCVLLQSQLASLPGVSKKKCLAQIILARGVVRACTIWGETGALLVERQKAYEVLAGYGDLDWEVVAAPGAASSSGPLPSSGYLRSTPTSSPLPSSDYLNSTPIPGISPSSGPLPSSDYLNSTPIPDTWGRMPAISRTQGTSLCIPRPRVTPLPREILASLPHAYRAVLMLVDGKRSLDEIAQLLHKMPQDVQQLLARLPKFVQM